MKSAVIGLLGDVTTFIGALILAMDALLARKAFLEKEKALENLRDPLSRRATVGVVIDGSVVMEPQQVEAFVVNRTFRRAIAGFFVLSIGLALLVACRVVEICS